MASTPDAYGRVRTNIVSWDGGGLATDIDILSETLRAIGCDIAYKGRKHRIARGRAHSLAMTGRELVTRCWALISRKPRFDINFFIESVFPEFLEVGRVNCLLANPEWFREENVEHLPKIDWILAKTPSGVVAFQGLPVRTRLIGFSSPDRLSSSDSHGAHLRCLHICGASSLKGTEAVVEVWLRHPEWPELIVVRNARRYGGGTAPSLPRGPNIQYETEYLSHERIKELQNACAVHVIPSQAEGYGHIIGEAMSCGAVVVTTDAAPMNELVGQDRGILVRVARSERMRLGTRNYVALDDLEAQLQRVFDMDAEARSHIGRRARAWYLAQGHAFQEALRAFINEVERSKAPPNTRRRIPVKKD